MKSSRVMAMHIQGMREAFDQGFRFALSQMNVMNSNEEIDEACEAAFIVWSIGKAAEGE